MLFTGKGVFWGRKLPFKVKGKKWIESPREPRKTAAETSAGAGEQPGWGAGGRRRLAHACAVRARAAGAGSEPRLRCQRQMRAGPGAWRPRGTALAERVATACGITARSPAGAVGPAQPEEAGRPRGCSGRPWGCHQPTRTAELAPHTQQPQERVLSPALALPAAEGAQRAPRRRTLVAARAEPCQESPQ